jgi:hypothetical protein
MRERIVSALRDAAVALRPMAARMRSEPASSRSLPARRTSDTVGNSLRIRRGCRCKPSMHCVCRSRDRHR